MRMKIITIRRKNIYTDGTFLYNGSKGKGEAPKAFFSKIPKGERRTIRKALRAMGFVWMSSSERMM